MPFHAFIQLLFGLNINTEMNLRFKDDTISLGIGSLDMLHPKADINDLAFKNVALYVIRGMQEIANKGRVEIVIRNRNTLCNIIGGIL